MSDQDYTRQQYEAELREQQRLQQMQPQQQPQQTQNNINVDAKSGFVGVMLVLIFMLVWVIGGFVAFIWSIVCFGNSGTTTEKIIGLLLAMFFGPFWFIYKIFSGTYCKKRF